jgi:hypothetical protein
LLQRTCEIWAFALSFAWKYFLLNQKWTYKKKEGGMIPQAISARKKELAGTRCSQGVGGAGWLGGQRDDESSSRSSSASKCQCDQLISTHLALQHEQQGLPMQTRRQV